MSGYAGPIEIGPCYDGTLDIDGVAMSNPFGAWHTPDLGALWSTPEQRGKNRLIPGVQGVKAYKRRNTETIYMLPFLAVGAVDRLGNLAVEGEQGEVLEQNITFLMLNVGLPTNVGDGTRVVTWTLPSGTTVVADAHVRLVGAPTTGAIYRGTLELSVPHGDLHLGA